MFAACVCSEHSESIKIKVMHLRHDLGVLLEPYNSFVLNLNSQQLISLFYLTNTGKYLLILKQHAGIEKKKRLGCRKIFQNAYL